MLSRREQRIWDDVQRFWAQEAEEPSWAPPLAPVRRRRPSRDPADLPAAVVTGAWITILMVLFGALVAGLAVGAATALGWALWHTWMRLGGPGTRDSAGSSRTDGVPRPPADRS